MMGRSFRTSLLIVVGLTSAPLGAYAQDEAPPAGDSDEIEAPPSDEGAAEVEPDAAAEPPVEQPQPPIDGPPASVTAEVAESSGFVPSPRVPTCAHIARDAAVDSVVRVRTGSTWGAGFVYHSPRHVVTAWSLMALGRPVTVVARDGTQLSAQLLAHDDQYDIAILQLSEDVPGATPLSPAPESSAEIGASVVAIGHPFAGMSRMMGERGEGLLRWSVSQGTLGAVNDTAMQADVALAVGHAGAPLLDCGGRVLGVVAGSGLLSEDLALAARIGQVDNLLDTAGAPSDFLGDMRLKLGIGIGLVIDEEGRSAAGFYIALGAVLFDRLSWMNRVGFYMGGIDGPSATELSVSRNLLRIESLIGYRIFLDIGGFTTAYIVPAIGATISFETVDRSTASVVPVAGPCTPSATESCVMPSVTRTSAENWLVRPAIGLNIMLGENFEIGYTLELGLDTPEEQAAANARGVVVDEVETYHSVRLGLLF